MEHGFDDKVGVFRFSKTNSLLVMLRFQWCQTIPRDDFKSKSNQFRGGYNSFNYQYRFKLSSIFFTGAVLRGRGTLD